MGAKVLRRWQARGKTGAAVRYIGLVIEGLDNKKAAEPEGATA